MSAAERRARDDFNAAVLARDDDCHLNPHRFGCGGRSDAHHIIPKQRLKAHTSTLPEEERWAIVYDPRIGIRVCRTAHTPLTNAAWRLTIAEVPEHAIEFAQEHGLGWAIELEVPGLVVLDV